jgi:hypothetical protein
VEELVDAQKKEPVGEDDGTSSGEAEADGESLPFSQRQKPEHFSAHASFPSPILRQAYQQSSSQMNRNVNNRTHQNLLHPLLHHNTVAGEMMKDELLATPSSGGMRYYERHSSHQDVGSCAGQQQQPFYHQVTEYKIELAPQSTDQRGKFPFQQFCPRPLQHNGKLNRNSFRGFTGRWQPA